VAERSSQPCPTGGAPLCSSQQSARATPCGTKKGPFGGDDACPEVSRAGALGEGVSSAAVQQQKLLGARPAEPPLVPPSSCCWWKGCGRERLDCPALLLHPTEAVRRRLLARASLNIYLPSAPPLLPDTQPLIRVLLLKTRAPGILCCLPSSSAHCFLLHRLVLGFLLLCIVPPTRTLSSHHPPTPQSHTHNRNHGMLPRPRPPIDRPGPAAHTFHRLNQQSSPTRPT
jgi:hypothetical protein